jgi:hypothetical protein
VVMFVNICIVCFSISTLTMFLQVISLELTMGMSANYHQLCVHHLYVAKAFFCEKRIGSHVFMALHHHAAH